MMKSTKYLLRFLPMLLLTNGIYLLAAPVVTTDLNRVVEEATHLSRTYGAEKVVIAFDIDDTLFNFEGDLGSQSWFSWQSSLLADPKAKGRVGQTFQDLLNFDNLVKSYLRMKPSQPDLSVIMGKLRKLGNPTLVVTVRGPANVVPAAREFLRSKVSFVNRQSPLRLTFNKDAMVPYSKESVAQTYNFSSEEIKAFKLDRDPEPISWMYGILGTSGQHKGAMLKMHIFKSLNDVKAIIYVDDVPKYLEQVQKAFENLPIEMKMIHYTRHAKLAATFANKDKTEIIRHQDEILKALNNP